MPNGKGWHVIEPDGRKSSPFANKQQLSLKLRMNWSELTARYLSLTKLID